MNITVGSHNPTKVQGVKNVVLQSDFLKDAVITAVDVQNEEFGHPKTMDEIVQGAQDRALAAYGGDGLSVGIESGMFFVNSIERYFEIEACAIYDGKNFAIGFSPAFEWPPKVKDMILDGKDGSQAFREAGFTASEKIGNEAGAVYTLTNGRISRTQLNELAFSAALIKIEYPLHYS